MQEEVFLIFDTETTGLGGIDLLPLHKQPKVFEFAGILAKVNKESVEEIDRINFLINPKMIIPDEVLKLTTIKQIEIENQPTFNDVAGEIEDIILSAQCIIGHNLMFDVKMVTNEFRRLGGHWTFPAKQRRICTVESSEHLLGRRLSLSDLHMHLFGEGFAGAHRAMVDVEATLRCFVELYKRGVIV